MDKNLKRLPVILLSSGLLLVGWFLLCENSLASSNLLTLRYVASNGNCGGKIPCYASLQAAVDAAMDGDELRVAAGRYTGVSARGGISQLVYLDKSITIQGGYHPQNWTLNPDLNPTILDAEGQGRVLSISGDIAPVVDGFHLVNGSADYGGGVIIDTAAAVLSHNKIYDNWAENGGGGVYLIKSPATILGNHIYTNTTGEAGRGGGLALADSPAEVEDNVIEDNSAHVGAGVIMNNTLGEGGALLTGNTIRNNVAYALVKDRTFDGAGGGIDISSYLTDTLRNNIISGNSAGWGGGVHAYGASAIIVDNTIQENEATTHGGGLYFQGGQLTLESNNVLSNTADNWGGGLALLADKAQVRRNTFRGNASNWRGGGMYSQSAVQFDGNRFLNNSAVEQGGGAFLIYGNGAVYQNSVFAGNQAAEGGGLYIWGANVRLLHSTIADNTSGDGCAVVIDKYPGLVSPTDPTLYTADVVFSNTIVSGQTVGFYATADNHLSVDGVLWHSTPTHFQAGGAHLTVVNERTGDPVFQPDGFHLRANSEARDWGASAVEQDVDGQLRDWGDKKDLGADEYVPTVVIDPENGGSLTYSSPQEDVTITVAVPPDVISQAMGLMFSPFPPLPPDVMDSPFGKFIAVGPPFRLEPYNLPPSTPLTTTVDPPLADPYDAVIFEHYPAHVIAEVGLEKMREMRKSMDRLELALLSLLSNPFPPANPACGPVVRDSENRIVDVPICDTGIIFGDATSTARLPVRLLEVDSGSRTGYFMFVVEVDESKVRLPLICVAQQSGAGH